MNAIALDDPYVGCYLDNPQRALLGKAAEVLEQVRTASQFKDCLDVVLQPLFPHGMLLCGLARRNDGQIVDPWVLAHRVPAEFDALANPVGSLEWPLLDRWLRARAPLLHAEEPYEVPTQWGRAQHVERPRLKQVALHGAPDFSGIFFSWFCFAGVAGLSEQRQGHLLRLLTPHLHFALLRIRCGQDKHHSAQRMLRLSERQLEVLHWVRLGKTNAEIGIILGTSEANIKYHLREVFRKLNVSNRTHAVMQVLAHESTAERAPRQDTRATAQAPR